MRSARFAPVHLSQTSTGDKFLGRPANRFYASPAVCYQKVDDGHPSQFFRFPVGLRCGVPEMFFGHFSNVQTGCTAHGASLFIGYRGLSPSPGEG